MMSTPRALDELASIANRQHGALETTLAVALEHAIAAGEALIEAHAQIPWGKWERWTKENLRFSHNCANQYILFATHRDVIEQAGVTTQNAARLLLRRQGLTRDGRDGSLKGGQKVQRKMAADMKAEGISRNQIAEILDVSPTTISNWLDPAACKRRQREYQKQRNRTKRLAEKQERELAVQRKGGSAAEGYSLIRKTLQVLQAAMDAEQDAQARRYLAAAMSYLHNAEDEIVKAAKREYAVPAHGGERVAA